MLMFYAARQYFEAQHAFDAIVAAAAEAVTALPRYVAISPLLHARF